MVIDPHFGSKNGSASARLKVALRPVFAALVCVLLSLGPIGGAAQAAAGNIYTVRFGGSLAETRVVIELNRPARGQMVSSVSQDNKLILAMPDLMAGGEMQGFGSGLVKSWVVDEAAGAVRLRLALSQPGTVKRQFLIPPGKDQAHYRYVLDIVPGVAGPIDQAKAGPVVPERVVTASAKPVALVKNFPVKRSVAPIPQRLKKIVVIDAGHGGHDPGAKGSEHWEKDINLGAALALKARLERSGDYKVVLTRSDDVFIPLVQRVQIARSAYADLFISLHSDSGMNDQTRGASVYTLSDKGSDRAAKSMLDKNDWLVNASLPTQDKAVKQILFDLTQRETKNRSANFAQILLDNIDQDVPLLAKSHRDAGFAVLLAPDVPAVLLEMGFITNREDESLLAGDDTRKDFMDSVGDAIDAYFAQSIHLASR